MTAGRPAQRKRLGIQALREMDRRRPDHLKLLEQIRQAAAREVRVLDVGVLVERRERSLVPTRNAKRAIREDPLGVADVAHDLLDGPLAGRVRVVRLVRRDRPWSIVTVSTACSRSSEIRLPSGTLRDVSVVVLEELIGLRAERS